MKKEYVLITPVHNEEKYIGQVIESVIAQTILPRKWVIVDDRSTDRTGEIIKEYAAQQDFIVKYPIQKSDKQTYYSQRIRAILAGIEYIGRIDYDFLAVLDADLTLEPTYYEDILKQFGLNPRLGIASGTYIDNIGGRLQKILRDKENISTSGGLQVFRRECYESIGGHVPLKYGGSDALVGILARMNGWETRCFPEYKAMHYRPTGVWGGNSILKARFRQGMQEYDLGTHTVFMLAKFLRRAFLEKPYLLGSTARLLGFFSLYFHRGKRGIPDAAVTYVRKEQVGRIFSFLKRIAYHQHRLQSDISTSEIEKTQLVKKDFILISPVYNEAEFIEQLIQSVTSQTIRPIKWIIVDDESTDGTGEKIKEYEKKHDFIQYHRVERKDGKSYYYNKIQAFLAGYETVKHIEHDFVACLDGDLTLESTYYEDILREFQLTPKLGVASGIYGNKVNGHFENVVRDGNSTAGGIQVFRRECYESIGGYRTLVYGGEDALADIMARMNGWYTRSFRKYETIHYRLIGVRGGTSALKGKFTQGLAEYHLGTHPVFMLAKSFRRMFIEKPYVIASIERLLGFTLAYLRGDKRDVSDEIRQYIRKEQLNRLFSWRHSYQR